MATITAQEVIWEGTPGSTCRGVKRQGHRKGPCEVIAVGNQGPGVGSCAPKWRELDTDGICYTYESISNELPCCFWNWARKSGACLLEGSHVPYIPGGSALQERTVISVSPSVLTLTVGGRNVRQGDLSKVKLRL